MTALQEYEQRRSGLPLNYLGDWQNQIDHLLQQEEGRNHATSLPQVWPTEEEIAYDNSMNLLT